MSIGKRIDAFLEVSEKFLRQARVERVSDEWAALDEVGITRADRRVDGGASLAHHFIGNGGASGSRGTGVIGNQSVGVMPAYGQDDA